jgi:hypothetical protein
VVLAIGVLPGLLKVLRADRVARPATEAVQATAKAQVPVEVREDAA